MFYNCIKFDNIYKITCKCDLNYAGLEQYNNYDIYWQRDLIRKGKLYAILHRSYDPWYQWHRWECCHYSSDISERVYLYDRPHTPSGSKTMKRIYFEEAVVVLGPVVLGQGYFCKLSAFVHVKSNILNA